MLIQQITSLRGKHQLQLREIYDESFPPAEKTRFETVLEALQDETRYFYACFQDNDLLGFAIVVRLSCEKYYLLEYLAISHHARSMGLGSQMLSAIVNTLQDANALFIEIESTKVNDPAERKKRERRARFYRQNQAVYLQEIGVYHVPDLSQPGHIPMDLYYIPIAEKTNPLSRQQLETCITAIFTDSYGLAKDDGMIGEILQSIDR